MQWEIVYQYKNLTMTKAYTKGLNEIAFIGSEFKNQ